MNTKKNKGKRFAAFAAAAAMIFTLSGCGSRSESGKTGETVSVTNTVSMTEETDAPETKSPTSPEAESSAPTQENFFADGYDPLSDDYDPYGGAGVQTVTGESAATLAPTEKTTEKVTEKTTVKTAAETKPAETSKTETTSKAAQTSSQTRKAEEKNDSKTDGKTENLSSQNTDAELIITLPNGWNDGTADYSQLDGTVKNNGKTNIDGWTATIIVGKSASIEQSWNCTATLDNGVLTVDPVEYNGNISPGGEGTFGMILKNPGDIDPAKASLKCTEGTYSGSSSSWQSAGNPPSAPVYTKDVPPPTTDDWLSVKGNKIVDKDGREVWLTGVNWFGYNTGTNTFDGLWACDLNTSLSEIANHGFNILRVPISAELIKNWSQGNYPEANYNHATNSYLVGMNSLEIFDYIIGQCRANGIKILIDIHSAKTDTMGHMKNMWYEGNITEADYLNALSWTADRYKNDDTILAYDLKNEPHGKANESPRAKWDGSTDSDNWKYIAEKAAKAVLDKNPNVLVLVEGIEIYPTDTKKNGSFSSTDPGDYYSTWWGGNLRGVKDHPLNLGKYNNKLVYSPHDYGPAVYKQKWFEGDYTYESLYKDAWYDNWLYINETKTAPILIGEWGGFMTQPNLKWMTYLRQLIKEKKLNHTFWCFNSNSGDTGGLVKDDFVTWDNEKYEFVKEVLWQENGKFVGLDHEIPLGENGKALGK